MKGKVKETRESKRKKGIEGDEVQRKRSEREEEEVQRKRSEEEGDEVIWDDDNNGNTMAASSERVNATSLTNVEFSVGDIDLNQPTTVLSQLSI